MGKILNERTIKPDESIALNDLEQKILSYFASNNLCLNLQTPEEKVITARNFIDRYRDQSLSSQVMASNKVELAYGLGQIFANAAGQKYNWSFTFLEFEDGLNGFAVVSGNRKACIFIHNYFYTLLTDKNRTNNCELLFNMLSGSQLADLSKLPGCTQLA